MSITRKIKTIGVVSALMTAAFVSGATAGTITGSAHDFTDAIGWQSGEDQICVFCHTPHNADITVSDAPLWNHALTQVTTYTLYNLSPTFDGVATITQPEGTSLLCLSCHDGTVAVDSFGGTNDGTYFLSGSKDIGEPTGDGLLNDHPISFTYDEPLATLDGGLFDPTITDVTIGAGTDEKTGKITDIMLFSGKLQCATCHDVHNKFTDGDSLLRVTKVGSKLCLTCHDK
ncbi:MAG: cytochrome c3 family protein [Pseudomonadota bacterium]